MPNSLIHIVSDGAILVCIALAQKKFRSHLVNIKIAGIQLVLANLIDVDHLLARPIYDAARCSLNFHPLHSWYIFPVYVAGLFLPKYRYFFVGIWLHLLLDYFNCFSLKY